jgi:hypothetical protein
MITNQTVLLVSIQRHCIKFHRCVAMKLWNVFQFSRVVLVRYVLVRYGLLSVLCSEGARGGAVG